MRDGGEREGGREEEGGRQQVKTEPSPRGEEKTQRQSNQHGNEDTHEKQTATKRQRIRQCRTLDSSGSCPEGAAGSGFTARLRQRLV